MALLNPKITKRELTWKLLFPWLFKKLLLLFLAVYPGWKFAFTLCQAFYVKEKIEKRWTYSYLFQSKGWFTKVLRKSEVGLRFGTFSLK